MIIWINGTYGIGKTAVAQRLKEIFVDKSIEILESDIYYQEMIKEMVEEAQKTNSFPFFGGTLPQNNSALIGKFREAIQEKLTEDKVIIVDMALTREECKKGLYEYFKNENAKMLHIILIASEEIIKSRIRRDDSRDKQCALENLEYNISFLKQNYPDAIRINTDNKSIDDVAYEIAHLIACS